MSALPAGPRMAPALQAAAWITRPIPWLRRLQREHGDVFTLRLPGQGPWIVHAHPDAVRELFTAPPDQLLAGAANELLGPILGPRSILLQDGADHLRARRLLLPPFHGERIGAQQALMLELARAEVARWPADGTAPVAPAMQAVTLEIILRVVFGVESERDVAPLRGALQGLLHVVGRPALMAAAFALGSERATRLPFVGAALDRVDREIAGVLARRRAAPDLDARDDILSLLLGARDADTGEGLGDGELRDELVTLLLAGHETTATALSWAVERLARHPEPLDRLRDELAAGESSYLEAVCLETLRLRPVLPVVVRAVVEPTVLAGTLLPVGAKAVAAIPLVHLREDVYPDPLAFRPERWLTAKPGTYTWIPFGGGTRRCLGATFALAEMRAVLEAVLAGSSLACDAPGERTRRRAITLAPARGATVSRAPAAV